MYVQAHESVVLFILSSRSFRSSAALLDDDLPYHIVVGMPALSPTMETGILSEWYLPEGGAFAAGQVLAKIETDKATIDFEAQDDGVIAKILMEAGNGNDIPVGTPIMVTVEEADDVEAFKDFKVEAAAPTPEPAAPPTPEPAPVVAAAPTPPPPAPTPAVVAAPVADIPPPPPPIEALIAAVAPVMSTGWGEFAKMNSPIVKTLSKQQKEYLEKYGTTGQPPL
jgi:pyruvate dehydrogenase E2 component (dihydrolipoamide acetyltransferase)